jgi:hypothetical protein
MRMSGELAGLLLKRLQRARALGVRPILIGGCGRSGTTLLLSVLSCHPRLFAIDYETMAFCADAFGDPPNLNVPFRMDRIYAHLVTRDVPEACVRWCEKTPKNVVNFGRLLHRYGDRARLIHIIRDGRAVVASRHPSEPGAYYVPPERWVGDVTAGLKFEDHPCVLTVRYEDLVSRYEATTRRICAFVDEAWAPEFLQFPASATVTDHVAWDARQVRPLSADGLDRWRSAEHEAAVGRLLALPEARALLTRLGYT